MSKKPSYSVQIFWSDEDNGYVAVVPDLSGCSAFGDTAEEALRESEDAIEAWVRPEATGNAVPSPSQLPLQKKYSGKVLLRMPQSLHGKLCRAAEEEGVSLNQYMVYLLADGVSFQASTAVAIDITLTPAYFRGHQALSRLRH